MNKIKRIILSSKTSKRESIILSIGIWICSLVMIAIGSILISIEGYMVKGIITFILGAISNLMLIKWDSMVVEWDRYV